MDGRLAALDNLRAFLALFGIPFHTVFLLGWYYHFLQPLDLALLVQDVSTQMRHFLLSVFYIHVFRMPAFFLLAGFFAHLIYQRRGKKKFILNRLHKIAVPFLFCVLWVLPLYFLFFVLVHFFPAIFPNFVINMVTALYDTSGGYWGIINDLRSTWFLYDLLWFYGFTLLMIQFKTQFRFFEKFLFSLAINRWRYVLIALFCSVILCQQPNLGFTAIAENLAPSFGLLAHYALWYCLGWCLWNHQDKFDLIFKHSFLKLGLSVLLYVFFVFCYLHYTKNAGFFLRNVNLFVYQLSSSLAVFAFMGICWNYFKNHHKIFHYLSNASYWVYLVQVPIIILLISWTYESKANFFIVSLKITVISLALSLLSYQFLVRHTWLSRFFGGKTNF